MIVLLVEDNKHLADGIIEHLKLEDIQCDYSSNGISALQLINDNHYDVIILDLNLPRLNGIDVCQHIRNEGNETPVIMLTARDQLNDKLTGFNAGADDYLVKPFAMAELIARLNALSHRVSRNCSVLHFHNLTLDTDSNIASLNGKIIKASPTGLKILKQLMLSNPKPQTYQQLIDAIWKDGEADKNTLKVHIHKLRKDLATESKPPLIQSIKSSGYALRVAHEDKNQH